MLEQIKKISEERKEMENSKEAVFQVLQQVCDLLGWKSIFLFEIAGAEQYPVEYFFRNGEIIGGELISISYDWEKASKKYFKAWMLPLIQRRLESLAFDQMKKLEEEKTAFQFFQKMIR